MPSAPAMSAPRWWSSRWSRRPGPRIAREEVIREVLLAQQPNKRFASVEEIGASGEFSWWQPCGSSITGVALPVDGGWTAH